MKRFALFYSECKHNAALFICIILVVALLFTGFIVVTHYSDQVSESLIYEFKNDKYISLQLSEQFNRDNIKNVKNCLLYTRESGLTYNTELKNAEKSLFVPDYIGGIAVDYTVTDVFLPVTMLYGAAVSNIEYGIWLMSGVSDKLDANVGGFVTVADIKYKIEGIYTDAHSAEFMQNTPSFIICYPNDRIPHGKSSVIAVRGLDNLLTLTESLTLIDVQDESVISLCSGYRVTKTLFAVISTVMAAAILLFIFFVTRLYINKRSIFYRNMYILGMSRYRVYLTVVSLLFALIAIAALLTLGLSALFSLLIDGWAAEILSMQASPVSYLPYLGILPAAIAAAAIFTAILLKGKSEENI